MYISIVSGLTCMLCCGAMHPCSEFSYQVIVMHSRQWLSLGSGCHMSTIKDFEPHIIVDQCLNSRHVTFLNTGWIVYCVRGNFRFCQAQLPFVFWCMDKYFANAVMHGCHILYAFIDTGQKISMINFESRWRNFLLAKLSMYAVVHLIHSSLLVIPIVHYNYYI